MATTGIWSIQKVYNKQLSGQWVTSPYVPVVPDQTYGWFGGGYAPGALFSRVDRIDYAQDTATAGVRGTLSINTMELASSGNASYGWLGGGRSGGGTPTSTVNRIDYSQDTNTTGTRGPLSLARFVLAATGNSNYGWFASGSAPSVPGNVSTVDRIDYSVDTATASTRGSLSVGAYNSSATGNSSFGWYAIGNFPRLSTVNRIDYSVDTATASTRGPLSSHTGRLNPHS